MYALLNGLSVIEASSFVAGPSAGLYLAQMGAEVIRVDQIGGGPDFRRWPLTHNGASLYWENLNRAKKSVALNLRAREGRELAQRLAASTGQFLTNYPADGFLSHARLAELRTDLITVRVMGHADGGTGLDYTVNAAVGLPYMTGPKELGDTPVNHVLPAWDLLTGAYTAFALLAAMTKRTATDAGGEVRVPLQDVAAGTVANLGMFAEAIDRGTSRPRYGNAVFGAFGRDFKTADGQHVILMAITQKQWTGLLEVLDINDDIAEMERECGVSFAENEGLRFAHRETIFPVIERAVATRSSVDLVSQLETKGCCFGVYKTMIEAAQDPDLVTHNAMFDQVSNPSGLEYPAAGAFASIAVMERRPPEPAPILGAHTDEVLNEKLGLSDGELGKLHDMGIIA